MTVYVIVGQNRSLDNVSARAAYSTLAEAEAHLLDPERMWFDDRASIVQLEIDAEAKGAGGKPLDFANKAGEQGWQSPQSKA